MSDASPTRKFDRISIDIAKLRDYCLSPVHPYGRHKARVFRSRLGLVAADDELLRETLRHAVQEHPQSLVQSKIDQHGVHYRLDFEMTTVVGTGTIRSFWLLGVGEDVLRLVTCYLR